MYLNFSVDIEQTKINMKKKFLWKKWLEELNLMSECQLIEQTMHIS
jgi:hypothetical protein